MDFPFKIRPGAEFDVVGFGSNAVDHLIRVPLFPEFGSKARFTEHSLAAGGEVASAMVGLTKLGMRTAYAGRFGDDPEGEFGLRSLIEAGIDVSGVEVISNARTQTAFILIDEASGERTILWHRDEKLAYTAGNAPTDAALKGRVLHMTTHDTMSCIEMARTARQNEVVVSIDIDSVTSGVDQLLPLVDVCIASAEFPGKFLGITGVKTALQEISTRFGCAITGVTLGNNGSLLFCDGTFIESKALEVPVGCVDTTGAGDAFRTGFLYGMLKGESIEDSSRIANAVAALKCRAPGARSGLPDEQELNCFLGATKMN